jgi:hypothetical protein
MVFSRFQKWITVTPKKMDRKHPLEKIKMVRKDINEGHNGPDIACNASMDAN